MIQLVKRVASIHSESVRRAEVAAHFKRFDEAERLYLEVERRWVRRGRRWVGGGEEVGWRWVGGGDVRWWWRGCIWRWRR